MNIADIWADALESGEYPQTEGCLHNEFGYCCLGVANEVFELGEDNFDTLYHTSQHLGLKGPSAMLRKPVKVNESVIYSLTDLNDNHFNFKQMAKLIREHPECIWGPSSDVPLIWEE